MYNATATIDLCLWAITHNGGDNEKSRTGVPDGAEEGGFFSNKIVFLYLFQ